MTRPVLYVFSKSNEMKKSLARFIKYIGIGEEMLKHEFDPKKHVVEFAIIEDIIAALDGEKPGKLLNAASILDISNISDEISPDLNPIKSSDTGKFISKLVLMYPEVYWIFWGASGFDQLKGTSWGKDHFVSALDVNQCIKLLRRHQNGYMPLFDPSGLRTSIKLNTLKIEKDEKENILEDYEDILHHRNNNCAVSIDEELPYAFLNGYTAYRQGYRCYTVLSLTEMLLEKQIVLSIEDLDLRFEDMNHDDTNKYRKVAQRPDYLNIKQRYFVTGVATHNEKKDFSKKLINKPYAGIYDLAKKMSIDNNDDNSISKINLTAKEQYFALQSIDNNSDSTDNSTAESTDTKGVKNHSADHSVLMIAESLISRCRQILSECNTCQKAVYGALLSIEAKEILQKHAVTTALEAISLQHQMEVQAECSFYGIGHEIVIDQRFDEIACKIDRTLEIEESSEPIQLTKSYNAQIEIINNIRLIFKEFEQFDEEDKCIDKIRHLMQGLHWFQAIERKEKCNLSELPARCRRQCGYLWTTIKNWSKSIGAFFRYPKLIVPLIEKYFVWLISSPLSLIVSILLWIFIFYPFYSVYMFCNDMYVFEAWSIDLSAFWQSALTFFEMQPANIIEGKGTLFNLLTLFELLVAYVHLGIFIAYLYQKLARR